MEPLRLNVGPSRTTLGGQRFPVMLGGFALGDLRLPYYDAARALLEQDANPDAPLEMWRDGVLCLSGLTVGQAAKLSVLERGGRPVTAVWEPYQNAV